ncbi:MAG: hypothetical protein ABR985_18390 [Methanotrichaceae archaeon]
MIFRLLDFCNILVLLSLAAATGSVQIRMLNAELHWSARRHQQRYFERRPIRILFPLVRLGHFFTLSGFNISSGFNASHELSSAFSSFCGFYANPGPEPAQRMGDTPIMALRCFMWVN